MSNIWDSPAEIKRDLLAIRDKHHHHLSQASFWVLCTDAKAIRNNRLMITTSRMATKTERLATKHDFKIIVFMEAWANLTDAQREIALDHALCRCGVKYRPKTVEINGKKEIVKDDLGRTIYTNQIEYDIENRPRWRIVPPDASIYFAMVHRHGQYCEELENIDRVASGKPLDLPEPTLFDKQPPAESSEAA